jgi:hypothetical protein
LTTFFAAGFLAGSADGAAISLAIIFHRFCNSACVPLPFL